MEEKETPARTMDELILAQLDVICLYIDQARLDVESGKINSIIKWKAGLRVLYSNIHSFLHLFLKPEEIDAIDQALDFLDKKIDPISQTIPQDYDAIRVTTDCLRNITDSLYEARNWVFMKYMKTDKPEQDEKRKID